MGLELDQEVSKLDIFKYNRQDSNPVYKNTIDSTESTSRVQKYNRQDSKYVQSTKIQ